MSTLEEKAKPILRSLIRGNQLVLSSRDRELLATWLAKTAMTAERYESGTGAIPQSDRDWMRDYQMPPVRWFIAIAGIHSRKWHTAVHRHGALLGKPPIVPGGRIAQDTQQTTIGLGWFLGVAVSTTCGGVEFNLANDTEGWLRQIWPAVSGEVVWPPDRFLITEGVNWVADTLPLSQGIPTVWANIQEPL